MTTPPLKLPSIPAWGSLYWPLTSRKTLRETLKTVYSAAGYSPYDPFAGGNGAPAGAKQFVKLFIQRAEEGWLRVIGTPDASLNAALAEALSLSGLYVWIQAEAGDVEVVGGGDLSDFLRPDKTAADLAQAQNATYTNVEAATPDEISALAAQAGLKPGQADKLIDKTTRTLFKKLEKQSDQSDGENLQEQAVILTQQVGFSWGLGSAQRVQAIAACLSLPETWASPSFQELAAAYQVARLLDINEDAPLLPGDEAALDKVDYPLDYTLAYYAR